MAKTKIAKDDFSPLFSRRLDVGTFNVMDKTKDPARPKLAAMLGKTKTLATVEMADEKTAHVEVFDGLKAEPAYVNDIDLSSNPDFEKRFQVKEDVENEFLMYFLENTECGTFKLFFVRTGAPGDPGCEIFLQLGDIIILRFYRHYKIERNFDCFEIQVDDVTPGWQEPIYQVEWPIKKKEKKTE